MSGRVRRPDTPVRRDVRRPGRAALRSLTSLAGLLLLVAGCVDTDASDPGDPTDDAADEATDDAAEELSMPSPEEIDPSQIPSEVDLTGLGDAPVTAALSWVLDVLAADAVPNEDVIASAFTDTVLAQATAADLRSVFAQLSGQYRLTSTTRLEPTGLVGVIDDDAGQRFTLTLEVVDERPVQIAGLFFAPPPPDAESFSDWDAATARLQELADQVGVLAAEVDEDGACTPISEVDADVRGPMGSVFKLYVLAALIDAIDDGAVSWDDVVTVEEPLISIPSGRLQDEAPGTEVTVQEAAALMISISDNTATDLLIDLLGRQTVEEALRAYGHDDPSVNQPLLTTREMAQLQWQVDDERRDRYIGGDESTRREILTELADLPLEIDVRQISRPVAPDAIEWFATPTEMCRVLTALDQRADAPGIEPVTDILRSNAIVELDDRWVTAAAKAGNQPGVLAGVWLLDRDDGQRFALAITLLDDDPIDMPGAFAAIEGALDLLAGS
jgi:hypothetical protein